MLLPPSYFLFLLPPSYFLLYSSTAMKRVGLIINPIAGMGGKVGLKGTDGEGTLERALTLGAFPESPRRAIDAVQKLLPIREELIIVTAPGDMGESAVRKCGLEPEVLGMDVTEPTTAEHTQTAAAQMLEIQVDLLLFAGGDGTARDIVARVGENIVSLGIPAGVKMHSAVFGVNPFRAGELAAHHLSDRSRKTRTAEVMDIDETALRQGHVSAQLFGYMTIPYRAGHVQGLKAGSTDNESLAQRSIAREIVDGLEEDVAYIVGPGSTTAELMKLLGLDYSLVGVDLIYNRRLEGRDLSEEDLLRSMGERNSKIIVTPVGGQGYLFGRGNQPISERVIRRVGKENIVVVATPQKLSCLRGEPLRVDTGVPDADRWLSGFWRIVTGYRAMSVYRVSFV